MVLMFLMFLMFLRIQPGLNTGCNPTPRSKSAGMVKNSKETIEVPH